MRFTIMKLNHTTFPWCNCISQWGNTPQLHWHHPSYLVLDFPWSKDFITRKSKAKLSTGRSQVQFSFLCTIEGWRDIRDCMLIGMFFIFIVNESRYTTRKICNVTLKQYPVLENNALRMTKSISSSLPVRHLTPR